MTCKELKNRVLNKTVDDSFLILLYTDTPFVINQYINQIAKDKKLDKVYIDSLKDIDSNVNNFFGTNENLLYILNTGTFKVEEDLSKYKNVIVIYKSVEGLDSFDGVVNFGKLTKEDILEYMQLLCPEISINNLEWLYDITGGDIYRIDNELNKLKLFTGTQSTLFEQIKNEHGYSDLNSSTIFSCINAFINKDIKTLADILSHLDVIDVEGTGLVTLLIRNIKNILDIQTNPKATAASTKMSDKQFYVVKKNCGKFTTAQLINMFEFLTEVDYRLKSGQLELDNSAFVGYILNNVMEIGYEAK